MAQLNFMNNQNQMQWNQPNGWINPNQPSQNGSNMSLNMPYYPQDQQMGPQPWMNNWGGPPGMYPYPMQMMPNG